LPKKKEAPITDVPPEIQALIEENEELIAEAEKHKNDLDKEHELLLRVSAEYENYRRRTTEEREKLYKDAAADTVSRFLNILDSFDRALQSEHDPEDPFYTGMALIAKQFSDIVESIGVKEIPVDIEFDPNLHNAVMHIDDEQYGQREIIEVFAKGYTLGDRVLRHSMVKVAN